MKIKSNMFWIYNITSELDHEIEWVNATVWKNHAITHADQVEPWPAAKRGE